MITMFGLFLVLGLIVFVIALIRDTERKKLVSQDDLLNLISECGLIGIIGGRALHIISEINKYHNLSDIIAIWNGGFSILGAIISVFVYLYFRTKFLKIEFLKLTDLAALYAPLFHAISRLGCFFVGCCFGKSTNLICAIRGLHPTQIYSSIIFLAIFLILFYKRKNSTIGQISYLYLILSCCERFFIDFLRGDRIIINSNHILSMHQYISLAIIVIFTFAYFKTKTNKTIYFQR